MGDPRNESPATNEVTRRRSTTASVIDPLLSQSVPIVEPVLSVESSAPASALESAAVVDKQIESRIDRLFADEPVVVDEVMRRDETGRFELPTIIPAEAEPELDARAQLGTDLPGRSVALVRPSADPDEFDLAVAGLDELDDSDGTGGLPSMARPTKPPRVLRAPVILRRRPRPRVRRVTRVVRQIDTWSVFKVSVVFSLFLYGVVLTAGVLLWKVAQNTGTIDNVQRFLESFGWKSFTLKGGAIFHQAWTAGLFGVVGLTGFAVLVATLFNLITDLVGGIRVTVLEEEVIARADRGLGWRRAGRRDQGMTSDSMLAGHADHDDLSV